MKINVISISEGRNYIVCQDRDVRDFWFVLSGLLSVQAFKSWGIVGIQRASGLRG